MSGEEALRLLNQITEIHNFLMEENERSAFYHMGMLTEELAMILRVSECSLEKKLAKHCY